MTRRRTGDHPDLKLVNPNAAAIEIGSRIHLAAVNPDGHASPVRAFETFTQDLHDLANWLHSYNVTPVAMESTGVYWISKNLVARLVSLTWNATQVGYKRRYGRYGCKPAVVTESKLEQPLHASRSDRVWVTDIT